MSPATGPEQPTTLAVYGDDDGVFDGRLAGFADATVVEVATLAALLDRVEDGLDCVLCTGTDATQVLESVRDEHRTPVVVIDEDGDVTRASRVSEHQHTLYVPGERLDDADFDLEPVVRELVADWWAMTDSRRRLTALESAREGIGILDSDGEYVYANRAYASQYGYEPFDLLGEHWRTLYPSAEVSRFEEEVLPTLEREGSWTGTAIGRRADGEEFPEELSLAMLDDGGHVCVLRDITDRLQREERLQVLDRVLRHNLRNKMCIVQGHIDDALRVTADDAVREPLEVAQREGEELLELAQKARRFHRLLDRATLSKTPVDLTEFVANVVDSMSMPDRTLEVTTIDDAVAVEVDPALLEAILQELVTVLVETNEDARTVTVSVGEASPRAVAVQIAIPDASLPAYEFDIVDRGEETPLYHGEGVGLWFVRWATVLMGGRVDLDTEADGVRLSFPRADTTLERAASDEV